MFSVLLLLIIIPSSLYFFILQEIRPYRKALAKHEEGRENERSSDFFHPGQDREGGGVQAVALEPAVGFQKCSRALGSVASIPHHGMFGQFGVAAYLVLAAGRQLALHQNIVGA